MMENVVIIRNLIGGTDIINNYKMLENNKWYQHYEITLIVILIMKLTSMTLKLYHKYLASE